MFDESSHGIPEGLDEMGPGPVLAGILSTLDVDSLTGYEAVVVLRATQRMVSHYNARVCADMAAIAERMVDPDDDPFEAVEWACQVLCVR